MRTGVALLLGFLAVSAQAVPVFIGTNTGQRAGGSKGIYLADFDPASGKLTEPALAAEYAQPGFLALHPKKPLLYAIGSPNKPFADRTGSVAAFVVKPGPKLEFLGEASSGGNGPCHLAVDPSGTTVAVANYGDGKFATMRLDERGVPGPPVSVIASTGSGPNKQRQDGPHAHGVYFNRAGDRLFVPDLGLDRVLVRAFDPATSKLGDALPPLATAPGAGPRHLAFSADESLVFVINELDATAQLARKDGDGNYQTIGTAPTLPDGFTAANTTAEIEPSPDGKFVYASNRGHDSIVVFRLDRARLAPIQHAPCGGKTPRHFKLSPCGKWLLCAHMESHTISVLPRDPATGRLGDPVCTVPSPSPICLLFGADSNR